MRQNHLQVSMMLLCHTVFFGKYLHWEPFSTDFIQSGANRAKKSQVGPKRAKQSHFMRKCQHCVQVMMMLLCHAVFWPVLTGETISDVTLQRSTFSEFSTTVFGLTSLIHQYDCGGGARPW